MARGGARGLSGPRRLAGLAALALLAACGRKADQPSVPIDDAQLNAIASAGPTVAEVLARGNDSVPAQPKPIAFDHRGTWAPKPAMCRGDGAWRFAATQVEVVGDTRCRVTRTTTVSADTIKLELACRTGAFDTIESWSLVRHEDGSMTVARSEGGDGVPRSTTLRRCG